MSSILLLGVLIGMHHAMKADHIAVVASIAADQASVSIRSRDHLIGKIRGSR